MFKYRNSRFIKLCLTLISEFVAMVATTLFSKYVFPIPHNVLVYLLCGAVLAAIVVSIYDKALAKRKTKAEQELRALTNAVLQIYHTHNK